MKIVIIGTAYPHRGGIAHFNALLYKVLQKNGHHVSMISFTRQYPNLLFPGKTQFETSKTSIPFKPEPMLDSISPLSWYKVAVKTREINPDLVIFRYWMPFFAPAYIIISLLVKAGRKTKILYVCDNIIPHEPRPGDKILTRLAVSTVDHFVVMSKSVKNDLLNLKPHANYVLVDHPVYVIFGEKYSKQEARRKLGIESNVPLILFFGYIRRYKGLHLLLDAFPKVLESINAKLLIAGEFYDERGSYIKKIDMLKLDKHIILNENFIPDDKVGLYFSATDIVALPYISATQSGVVQIAYNYDRPVIATPVGGLPEVIIQDKTGYVVSEIASGAFADGIVHLLNKKSEVDFESNINDYKKRFSWYLLAKKIETMVSCRS